MGTIVKRKRKDRSTAWLATVRITRHGHQVHRESKTFDLLADARQWIVTREALLSRPGALRIERRMTLGELVGKYVDEYGNHDRWGRTKKADIARLKGSAIAELPLDQVTAKVLIEHVRLRRQQGAGPATALNDLIWLGVLYKTAGPAWGLDVDREVVATALALCRQERLVARPRERNRRPTLAELDALLAHFEQARAGKLPMIDLVLFLLFSGRREAEACALRWDDLQGKRIIVRDTKDPRSPRDHLALLTPEALAVIHRQPRTADRIFPYLPKSISARWQLACKALGIDDLHIHDLRHECISWLFETGMTIPQVAQVSGHRSWNTLKRYAHLEADATAGGGKPLDKYAGWRWRPKLVSASLWSVKTCS